jgi:hypothetical protein
MFVGMKLGEVTEPKPVPDGRYKLRILDAEVKDPKEPGKGQTIHVNIGFVDHPTAPNIRHFLSLPKAGEEPGKSQFKALMLKRFLTQFGIQHGDEGFNVEDLHGAEADAMVSSTSPDDNESGAIYNRLQVDKLKS